MAKPSSQATHKFWLWSLPDKLFLLIFQALVHDMYCTDDELRLDCFTLSSVCRGWRILILSTPQFWTRLHMLIRPRALSSARLETNVKRSANALVDVVIYLPNPPNSRVLALGTGPPFPRTKACLEVLRGCSHRWRSFRIFKEEGIYTELFNSVLSRLRLCHAPALHEVEIICPSSGWVAFVTESFQLLLNTGGKLDLVILLALHILSIVMDTEKPNYLCGILGVIAAPNLSHFAGYGDSLAWERCTPLDFSSPAFFLSQDQTLKFSSVRKLTMKNMFQSTYGPGKNIHSIFTAFPRVTEAVSDYDVREIADHFAIESYDRKAPPPWPCLRQLTIEMSPMTGFHYLQQLLEWLRLRRRRMLPLPVVIIRYGLQGPQVNDTRDLTAIRRIVNDATGYRTSDTREVVKQLGKLGALVG
ncbi:hypothetical protein M405DRAFT_841949 [Rhizopogon salebrosus TDB-379]|nr:hypothetical protein M405DRAFT_841949 [Rhizopogon salebrosus TDB-379]